MLHGENPVFRLFAEVDIRFRAKNQLLYMGRLSVLIPLVACLVATTAIRSAMETLCLFFSPIHMLYHSVQLNGSQL